MKKMVKCVLGIAVGVLTFGMTTFAAEEKVIVNPAEGAGYSNETTVVYAEPNIKGTVILNAEQCPDNIGIFITGVTNNGFFEVDLGQPVKFYIAGNTLVNVNVKMLEATDANTNADTKTNQTAETVNTASQADEEAIKYLVEQYRQECFGYGVKFSPDCEKDVRKVYFAYKEVIEKALANPKANVDYISSSDIETTFYGITGVTGPYFRKVYPNMCITVDDETYGSIHALVYKEKAPDGWYING